jgi:hypothetical protein
MKDASESLTKTQKAFLELMAEPNTYYRRVLRGYEVCRGMKGLRVFRLQTIFALSDNGYLVNCQISGAGRAALSPADPKPRERSHE